MPFRCFSSMHPWLLRGASLPVLPSLNSQTKPGIFPEILILNAIEKKRQFLPKVTKFFDYALWYLILARINFWTATKKAQLYTKFTAFVSPATPAAFSTARPPPGTSLPGLPPKAGANYNYFHQAQGLVPYHPGVFFGAFLNSPLFGPVPEFCSFLGNLFVWPQRAN